MWTPEKTENFRQAFYKFVTYLRIDSRETGGRSPLVLYDAQKRFFEGIFSGLAEDKHHVVCLKSRQLGITTGSLALDLFWAGMHEGLQGAIVFDTDANKEKARKLISRYIESLASAKQLGFPKLISNQRYLFEFDNGSLLDLLVAGVKKSKGSGGLGRSRGLNYLHACCAPGTPVIVEHGRIKNIEDVEIGDVVLTHTGRITQVVDVVGQPNKKGDLIKIHPWLGHALCFTAEHTIPTQRGIIEAKDVKKSDWLIMPIRQIINEAAYVQLPGTPPRAQRGGSISVGAGNFVALTEEFGFACGYYLAEGSVLLQAVSGRGAAIQFTRHRNEKHYSDRAIAALSPHVSGMRRTKDIKNCLTTTEIVYGASLAEWFKATFGITDNKHIPDVVFSWGEDFCRGLLVGLLAGDGSKGLEKGQGYDLPRMILPTTRASIAMQARDIAASLGYGWASMAFKPAGNHYGRNCKPCWRVVWSGSAARRIRSLMGFAAAKTGGRPHIEKYKIENNAVWLKIRNIENGIKAEKIWDISVLDDDHTFRTPYMAIGNTEVSSWGDREGLRSLRESLSEQFENRLYVWESTARGFNIFNKMWEEAKADTLTQTAVFIGWWAKENQRIKQGTPLFERYGTAPPTTDEQAKIESVQHLYGHTVDMEQLAWMRHKEDPRTDVSTVSDDDDEDADLLQQEQPWTEDDAFLASGSQFFSTDSLTEAMKKASRSPSTGWRYFMTSEFLATQIEETSKKNAVLRVWEMPEEGGHYVVGADPAYGSSPEGDRYVIEVLRVYADGADQVAEFVCTVMETYHFTWVISHLCGAYYNARLLLELNGPGNAVLTEWRLLEQQVKLGYLKEDASKRGLKNIFDNVKHFMYARADSISRNPSAYHFETSEKRKKQIMNRLRDNFQMGTLNLRSFELLQEMKHIIQDGDSIKGEGVKKDDRVMAMALAVHAWEDSERKRLIAQNATRAVEAKKKNLSPEQANDIFAQDILTDFLARKQVERERMARRMKRGVRWNW